MPDNITAKYGFVSPDDSGDMKNTTKYLNDNWTRVKNGVKPTTLTAVPDSPTAGYIAGNRIYITGGTHPVGIYLCIGVDPDWGTFWRPITSKYGPWLRPGPVASPSSVLADTTNYLISDSDNPFQYRLTRNNTIQFRGCIKRVSGFFKDVTDTPGYSDTSIFKTIPSCIRPGSSVTPYPALIQTCPYPGSSSPTLRYTSYMRFNPSNNKFLLQINTATAAITKLFFSGAEYSIGDMGFNS